MYYTIVYIYIYIYIYCKPRMATLLYKVPALRYKRIADTTVIFNIKTMVTILKLSLFTI